MKRLLTCLFATAILTTAANADAFDKVVQVCGDAAADDGKFGAALTDAGYIVPGPADLPDVAARMAYVFEAENYVVAEEPTLPLSPEQSVADQLAVLELISGGLFPSMEVYIDPENTDLTVIVTGTPFPECKASLLTPAEVAPPTIPQISGGEISQDNENDQFSDFLIESKDRPVTYTRKITPYDLIATQDSFGRADTISQWGVRR